MARAHHHADPILSSIHHKQETLLGGHAETPKQEYNPGAETSVRCFAFHSVLREVEPSISRTVDHAFTVS